MKDKRIYVTLASLLSILVAVVVVAILTGSDPYIKDFQTTGMYVMGTSPSVSQATFQDNVYTIQDNKSFDENMDDAYFDALGNIVMKPTKEVRKNYKVGDVIIYNNPSSGTPVITGTIITLTKNTLVLQQATIFEIVEEMEYAIKSESVSQEEAEKATMMYTPDGVMSLYDIKNYAACAQQVAYTTKSDSIDCRYDELNPILQDKIQIANTESISDIGEDSNLSNGFVFTIGADQLKELLTKLSSSTECSESSNFSDFIDTQVDDIVKALEDVSIISGINDHSDLVNMIKEQLKAELMASGLYNVFELVAMYDCVENYVNDVNEQIEKVINNIRNGIAETNANMMELKILGGRAWLKNGGVNYSDTRVVVPQSMLVIDYVRSYTEGLASYFSGEIKVTYKNSTRVTKHRYTEKLRFSEFGDNIESVEFLDDGWDGKVKFEIQDENGNFLYYYESDWASLKYSDLSDDIAKKYPDKFDKNTDVLWLKEDPILLEQNRILGSGSQISNGAVIQIKSAESAQKSNGVSVDIDFRYMILAEIEVYLSDFDFYFDFSLIHTRIQTDISMGIDVTLSADIQAALDLQLKQDVKPSPKTGWFMQIRGIDENDLFPDPDVEFVVPLGYISFIGVVPPNAVEAIPIYIGIDLYVEFDGNVQIRARMSANMTLQNRIEFSFDTRSENMIEYDWQKNLDYTLYMGIGAQADLGARIGAEINLGMFGSKFVAFRAGVEGQLGLSGHIKYATGSSLPKDYFGVGGSLDLDVDIYYEVRLSIGLKISKFDFGDASYYKKGVILELIDINKSYQSDFDEDSQYLNFSSNKIIDEELVQVFKDTCFSKTVPTYGDITFEMTDTGAIIRFGIDDFFNLTSDTIKLEFISSRVDKPNVVVYVEIDRSTKFQEFTVEGIAGGLSYELNVYGDYGITVVDESGIEDVEIILGGLLNSSGSTKITTPKREPEWSNQEIDSFNETAIGVNLGEYSDIDSAITLRKIEILNTLSGEMDIMYVSRSENNEIRNITGLDTNTEYRIRIILEIDLYDGNGPYEQIVFEEYVTTLKDNPVVIDTSVVAVGESGFVFNYTIMNDDYAIRELKIIIKNSVQKVQTEFILTEFDSGIYTQEVDNLPSDEIFTINYDAVYVKSEDGEEINSDIAYGLVSVETNKLSPKVSDLELVSVTSDTIGISYLLKDVDSAVKALYVKIENENNKLDTDTIRIFDYNPGVSSTYEFIELDSNTTYIITFIADYDLGDGEGIQYGKQISGTLEVTTMKKEPSIDQNTTFELYDDGQGEYLGMYYFIDDIDGALKQLFVNIQACGEPIENNRETSTEENCNEIPGTPPLVKMEINDFVSDSVNYLSFPREYTIYQISFELIYDIGEGEVTIYEHARNTYMQDKDVPIIENFELNEDNITHNSAEVSFKFIDKHLAIQDIKIIAENKFNSLNRIVIDDIRTDTYESGDTITVNITGLMVNESYKITLLMSYDLLKSDGTGVVNDEYVDELDVHTNNIAPELDYFSYDYRIEDLTYGDEYHSTMDLTYRIYDPSFAIESYIIKLYMCEYITEDSRGVRICETNNNSGTVGVAPESLIIIKFGNIEGANYQITEDMYDLRGNLSGEVTVEGLLSNRHYKVEIEVNYKENNVHNNNVISKDLTAISNYGNVFETFYIIPEVTIDNVEYVTCPNDILKECSNGTDKNDIYEFNTAVYTIRISDYGNVIKYEEDIFTLKYTYANIFTGSIGEGTIQVSEDDVINGADITIMHYIDSSTEYDLKFEAKLTETQPIVTTNLYLNVANTSEQAYTYTTKERPRRFNITGTDGYGKGEINYEEIASKNSYDGDKDLEHEFNIVNTNFGGNDYVVIDYSLGDGELAPESVTLTVSYKSNTRAMDDNILIYGIKESGVIIVTGLNSNTKYAIEVMTVTYGDNISFEDGSTSREIMTMYTEPDIEMSLEEFYVGAGWNYHYVEYKFNMVGYENTSDFSGVTLYVDVRDTDGNSVLGKHVDGLSHSSTGVWINYGQLEVDSTKTGMVTIPYVNGGPTSIRIENLAQNETYQIYVELSVDLTHSSGEYIYDEEINIYSPVKVYNSEIVSENDSPYEYKYYDECSENGFRECRFTTYSYSESSGRLGEIKTSTTNPYNSDVDSSTSFIQATNSKMVGGLNETYGISYLIAFYDSRYADAYVNESDGDYTNIYGMLYDFREVKFDITIDIKGDSKSATQYYYDENYNSTYELATRVDLNGIMVQEGPDLEKATLSDSNRYETNFYSEIYLFNMNDDVADLFITSYITYGRNDGKTEISSEIAFVRENLLTDENENAGNLVTGKFLKYINTRTV